MLNQNYASGDAFGAGIPPVSLPNMYMSPPAHHRAQATIENNVRFTSPTVPQPSFHQNAGSSLPSVVHPSQHIVTGVSYQNQDISSGRQMENEQGRKVDVDLIERGEVYSRTSLYLKVLNPQLTNPGCRERLQIQLTGQYRGMVFT